MSYTIPSSVQTKAEAVLAVASAIADTDMGARYDGTVNTSLDVLADVLAAQDVDVPQTNAGVILALAQYAHGGGGGGLNVGNYAVIEVVRELPEPGGYLGDYGCYISEVLYSNRPIARSYRNDIGGAASGMTVHTGNVSTSGISFYKATYNSDEVYTSFESIEISATELTVDPPLTGYYYEFVVPEMGDSESLFFVCAMES